MITRWATTQAKREMACPRCNAAPESDCQTPKGRYAQVHVERSDAYVRSIGIQEFERRHMGFPGKVFDADIEK